MRLLPSLGVALLATFLTQAALAQGRPAGVETAVVTMREMSETITVFGQVVAERESAVATRVAGIANELPIRVGSIVAAGDVLLRMDTERLGIELARAETERAIAQAGVTIAETRLERARKALERAENLRANSTIADAQLEDRQSDFAEGQGAAQEALARIARAENAMDLAQYNLRNSVVRAPFPGVVLDVTSAVGQFVTAGSKVATLLDLTSLEVQANVPASFVEALTPGRPVLGETDTRATLELTLRATLPTEFSNTRTRPVLFQFSRIDESVAVGQSVTLKIPVGDARDVVVVPKDALVQARGGWSAFVNEDGTASPRTVEIGAAIGDSFEVISGLAPGDEVVVRGNERLRPGQAISVAGAGGRPGGGAPGGPPGGAAGGAPGGAPAGAGGNGPPAGASQGGAPDGAPEKD